VNGECVKLTTYFGERDRCDGRFLADALLDLYGDNAVQASVLMRATEGFGIKHRLQTQQLLTLSEDLPLVSVAIDARERIEALVPEVTRISTHGLITLERARFATAGAEVPRGSQAKLTVYLGRGQRAAQTTVAVLHRHGVAGATALLGIDGTRHGSRHRARFFGANLEVPVMVIAVGDETPIRSALAELETAVTRPLMTLERLRVCKRDGQLLAAPAEVPATDASGLALWQKLMVYSSARARHEGDPVHRALVRRLRTEGAAGATALRGFWGYHGDHEPHGDSFWSLRRRVPVVTVIVDTPANVRRWFAIVDELTDEAGLVTSEVVPALRATGPEAEHGGLALAARRGGDA
jgi:PII-like signaling protein